MANFLNLENVTKSYGDRLLFGDITFGVDEGDKIGIVARNGTGKSTLLRVIAGEESPDSGNVIFRSGVRVGYLPQDPVFQPGTTVIQAALDSGDPTAAIVRRYEEAIAGGTHKVQEEAVRLMDESSAWDYQDRLRQLLTRLGLDNPNQSVDTLSGGQRKRLALARAVISDPEFIILDEPTNHLDITTIEWLENYLKRSRATLLLVTHDRYFLDRICNRIIELDQTQAFVVEGNYEMYHRRRAERIEAMTAELAKVRNTLRKEQEWMSRQPQARAGKAKFRIDNFYELKSRSNVNLTEKNVRLEGGSSRLGSKIFEARGVSKSFGDKRILDDFTYTFARGEKVGIVGENGVGKSTFVKMLQGLEPIDSGSWDVGTTIRFGYYRQDGLSFDQNKRVVDAVTEFADDIEMATGEHIAPMQYLQQFLFSPKDQQKFIHTLSGGERCRLHLATVLMQRPNFLILDEPTNDLDIITLGILEEYLADFKGCAIIISHDRYFLDNIVDHLFVMEGDGVVRDFPGNYSDYRQFLEMRQKDAGNTRPRIQQPDRKPRQARADRLTFKEKRELESLEKELAELNAEKESLEMFFASADAVAQEEYAGKSRRYSEIGPIIDEKELRWLELSEKE